MPGDRLYAIENGPSGFDPSAPAYLSKQHFPMLMKNERLAALRTAFDQASHVLRIQDGESEAARGDLRTDKSRAGAGRHSPMSVHQCAAPSPVRPGGVTATAKSAASPTSPAYQRFQAPGTVSPGASAMRGSASGLKPFTG